MATNSISLDLAFWQVLCIGLGASALSVAIIAIGAKVLRIWL